MTDNLRHWSALERTDPTVTKPFRRAGGFSGIATKPIYHTKRMTEHFGPCGVGWGMEKPDFQLVPAEGEILVFCTACVWYVETDTVARVYGVGGDKVVAKRNDGAPFVSDEAFKAAFTDALGNAMKHIGVGADIHMGEFDKYGRDETTPRRAAPPPAGERDPFVEPAAPQPPPRPPRQVPPAVDPNHHAKHERATEARDRIKLALTKAKTPKLIDEIITVNDADLAFIKDFHEPTYVSLMQLAAGRKTDLVAAA